MKKWIIGIVAACSLLISGVAIGESINGSFNGNPIVKVVSDGKVLTDEVPAQVIDGKTMVPLTMLRQFGFDVKWDQSTYTVTVNNTVKNEDVSKKKLTASDIARLTDRVATIITYDQFGRPLSQGSGFVINQWGLLITNSHVTRNAASWDIKINGSTYHHNWWWYNNVNTDVFGTYVNVDTTGKVPPNVNFSFIPYNTNLPEVGDRVYAIGSPDGLTNTVSEGIVSGIRMVNGQTLIQHTAFTDHGSSGGVLLNEYGEAIGVTSSGIEKTQANFAIPMSVIQDELNKKK